MRDRPFATLRVRFWMRREAYESLLENTHDGVQFGAADEPRLLQNLRMIYPYSSSCLRVSPDKVHVQERANGHDEWVGAEISYAAVNRYETPAPYATMRELQATAMIAMNPELQPHFVFGDPGAISDHDDAYEIVSGPYTVPAERQNDPAFPAYTPAVA